MNKPLFGLLNHATKSFLALAVFLFVATTVAQAQQYQVSFTGKVTSLTGTIDPSVSIGSDFQYIVLYDISTAPWRSNGTVSADYEVLSMNITVGTYSLSLGNQNIQMSSNYPVGFPIPDYHTWGYSINQYEGDSATTYASVRVTTRLNSFVAPNTSLASLQEFPVSDFEERSDFYVGFNGGANQINGQVLSYTVEAVPEPSIWALLGLGVVVVLWQFRRRVASATFYRR